MRLNSLALRLFFSATTWTVVILVVTGVVLSSIYRAAVERAFDRRLGVYLRTLVADVATPEENAGKFPQSIGEPLFDLPLSGWYWQVTRLDAPTPDVRSSRSLWDATLPHLADLAVSSAPGAREGYAEGPEGQKLRIVERTVDLGEEGRYLVAVAGDAAEIDAETHSFDVALLMTFGMLGDRAAADHDLSGAVRSRPAQTHLRGSCRHPFGPLRSGSKAPFRSRSRRSRAKRMRSSTPTVRLSRARAPMSGTSPMH